MSLLTWIARRPGWSFRLVWVWFGWLAVVRWLVCSVSRARRSSSPPTHSPPPPSLLLPLPGGGFGHTTGLWLPPLHYRWEGGSLWTAKAAQQTKWAQRSAALLDCCCYTAFLPVGFFMQDMVTFMEGAVFTSQGLLLGISVRLFQQCVCNHSSSILAGSL